MSERLYFIGIVPPSPLACEIRERQERVSRDHSLEYVLRSPPHIPLIAPFLFEEELLPHLKEELLGKLGTFPTFSIVLHGHGFFEPHTLFLHVLRNRYLRLLEDQLHVALSELFPATTWQKRKRFHPHIALARKDVSAEVFFRLQKEFVEKPFHASFAVSHYELLEWHAESWQVISKIPLRDLPVSS